METRYIRPRLPSRFYLVDTQYRCAQCDDVFHWIWSEDNALVKFQEKGGAEERWLSTYGEGGYLDLLQRLVPEVRDAEEITPRVVAAFDNAFAVYQEPSSNGNLFVVERGVACPHCGSRNLRILNERTIDTPSVKPMAYRHLPGTVK